VDYGADEWTDFTLDFRDPKFTQAISLAGAAILLAGAAAL
jgi:hypothetical protein